MRRVLIKAQTLQPGSRVFATSDDDAHRVAIEALAQNAPERVGPRDLLRSAPNARVPWQESLTMPWVSLVVVELVKEQQRAPLHALIEVSKYFRIVFWRATRIKPPSGWITDRKRSGKSFSNST